MISGASRLRTKPLESTRASSNGASPRTASLARRVAMMSNAMASRIEFWYSASTDSSSATANGNVTCTNPSATSGSERIIAWGSVDGSTPNSGRSGDAPRETSGAKRSTMPSSIVSTSMSPTTTTVARSGRYQSS
jgi:hypothetical protein